ncbi:MAG: hypothetical protein DWQ47_03460 [Acidobacteria bacterium]|nr:MAG: hypothetical protein DWQ32_07010 [Acidobacteriota bacterium]REK01461.1 MAG: hypothetical protein DWQ38_03445 [Acidobacteriota bacterium]REK14417.1 MAG: hypothetical protein DWQ43_12700 [Acidobacteriota bacterium]REK45132.1 MAG: hypothetical protein DWQ47_03460 [Acidobacteriota bacterium]
MPELSERYASLPIEKKVGHLFIIGLPGEQLDESTYGLLVQMAPSGVCLFARNTRSASKTRMQIESLRDALLYEPFVCIDQEGGLVDRLRRIVEPMPSPTDVCERGTLDDLRMLARITAETVRILGFNVNFAPVVDVITKAREHFNNGLRSRGLGTDAKVVAERSTAYLDELQQGGVLGCLKHFPGIGAAEVDSHDELPEVFIEEEEIRSVDLEPYRKHFSSGRALAVMTGHAAFPNTDFQETDGEGRYIPTSLSRNVVTGLLRTELGFEGASLTDDLEMGAVVRNYGMGEACVMAVEAGHDLLLVCNSLSSVELGYRGILEAVRNGRISEDRLNVSLERISSFRRGLEEPLRFDEDRLMELSDEIVDLKKRIGG